MLRYVLALVLVCGCDDGQLLAYGTAPDPTPAPEQGVEQVPGMPIPPAGGAVAAVRLIAPMSTSTTTSRRPTLHWLRSGGAGTILVDLCADRACTQPLATHATVSADRTSARPDDELPSGWVFWRVRVVGRDGETQSPTWQMWIPKASTPVDTSGGTTFDVNGDGYADLLIGAGNRDVAHIFLGNATGSNFQRIDLESPDGPDAWPPGYCYGGSVCFGGSTANIGDINGDGYSDFVVASWYINFGPGNLHVYLGGPSLDTTRWNGPAAPDRFDIARVFPEFGNVSAAGDVDGDGYADFLQGGMDSSYGAGVYFGSAQPAVADWIGQGPAKAIWLYSPDQIYNTNYIGFGPYAALGDINGDGLADFVVGANSYASDTHYGFAHVYLGTRNPTAAMWNTPGVGTAPRRLDILSPDENGTTWTQFGVAVGMAGDVNGDGYNDILVGAPQSTGIAHLYYGGPARGDADWNGANAPQRVALTVPAGENYFGWSFAHGGDLNGDGYDDFVIGAGDDISLHTNGGAHVYFGGPARTVADWNGAGAPLRIDIASPDGLDGRFAQIMGSVGDLDGDGLADFIVGAMNAFNYDGAAHVVRGVANPDSTTWNGVTAPGRIDLMSPDPAGGFGNALN